MYRCTSQLDDLLQQQIMDYNHVGSISETMFNALILCTLICICFVVDLHSPFIIKKANKGFKGKFQNPLPFSVHQQNTKETAYTLY